MWSFTFRKLMERIKSPDFLTLFNSTVSVALFNDCKLRTYVSIVISPTAVTVVKQLVQLCDQLLHNNGLVTMVTRLNP
jgi:hypothetical protein